MAPNATGGPTDILDIGTLTAIVAIITLVVLVLQTKIFSRQSHLMEKQVQLMQKQSEISDAQIRVSEAVALSLEITFRHPSWLRINIKNEGKGIAHNPTIKYDVIDAVKVILHGVLELQPIGANSTQDATITLPSGYGKPRPETLVVCEWTAVASDGRSYHGEYSRQGPDIPVEGYVMDRRLRIRL